MRVFEGSEEVVIGMSPEEWAELRRAYQSAWFFLRNAVKESIPTGRTVGKRPLDEVHSAEEIQNDRISHLARRLTDETTRINALRNMLHEVRDNYVPQDSFEDLVGRIRRLESQTQFETSEDDARIKDLVKRLGDIENRLDTYGVPVVAPRVGVTVTYNEAERRIRNYMTGHWSEASVEAVVAALRGIEDATGGVVKPAEVRTESAVLDKIIDHAFRYSAPDRRH